MCQYRSAAALAIVVLVSSLSQAKHEQWIEVRSAHFLVVSNAGEKQARKTALQFEEIRAVFRESIAIANAHPSPFVTVLAARDEGTMRELLPEYWVKGHTHPAGLFSDRLYQYFAAVQLDADTQYEPADPRVKSNPFDTLYHEYYHSITMPYFPDLPVWLSEGLAEVFGHTEIQEKYVGMGESDSLLLTELNQQPLIPLNILFKVDQSSPYYNESNRSSIFYAESWALTHYLMVGDRQAHKQLLVSYLDALDRGKSEEEAANLAFGDLNKLQATLQGYVHQALFFYLKLPPPKVADDNPKVRVLSDGEAEAYRGGFAAVRGQNQQAAELLTDAVRLDPNVAIGHEYLAMTQFLAGQREKALESASRSVALNPDNASARYLRAVIATSGGGMMTTNAPVEEDLRKAIALDPDFSPPYALLGVYLAARTQNHADALQFARKAVALEPASSNYQLSLAQVLARMNEFKEADIAAARATAWARNPQEKANAEAVQSFLEQAKRFQSLQSEEASEDAAEPVATHLAGNPGSPGSPAMTAVHLQMNVTLLSAPPVEGLRSYVNDVLSRLRNPLLTTANPALIKQPCNLTLSFDVAKDGTVSNLKLTSSSGDSGLDQSVRDAFAKASPLKAWPSDWDSKKPLTLQMNLAYSRETVTPP